MAALQEDAQAEIIRFINQLPFNRCLGYELTKVSEERVEAKLPMRPELIGNSFTGILHGGVISSALDVTGGSMALVGAMQRLSDLSASERMQRLSRFGTIDLRVDYLRPGRGQCFYMTAGLLRSGNKVAVTRSEFYNDQHELCAVGTGSYLYG